MNPLFKKPKDVRFVDMAIWIDENIYRDDCDLDKAFTYMYLLAYMLASKEKLFKNLNDYDNFAYYLAYSTFSRYQLKEKKKIKSVLNYMKSILYWRKLAYDRETFNEIISPEYNKGWDGDKYKSNQISSIETSLHTNILQNSINDIFADVPKIVKNNIPKVYKMDSLLYNNLYTSVLLSLLSSYTLPKVDEEKYNKKLTVEYKSAFDEMSFYKKHLTKDIILWNIPDNMESVVQLIINKVNAELVSIIKDLSCDVKISDHEFEMISRSAYENYEVDSKHDWS